jgi:hypothetical protein
MAVLTDEGGNMRKKRLFALSLMMGLSASFITLQINSASVASAQDAKAKQDGLYHRVFVIGDRCVG